jgi:tocopherol cyclase
MKALLRYRIRKLIFTALWLLCPLLVTGCVDAIARRTPATPAVEVNEGRSQSFALNVSPLYRGTIEWWLDGERVQAGGDSYSYQADTDDVAQQHVLTAFATGDGKKAEVQWRIADDVDLMPAEHNNPHVPATKGPWFEGWYTRVQDPATGRSIAVIVASYLPSGENYQIGKDYTGYINVLVSEGNGAPTLSYTVFPQHTRSLVGGVAVTANPLPLSPAQFRWEADGFGYITQSDIHLSIPDVVDIDIDTHNRLPFDRSDTNRRPEGVLAQLPLPLNWFIHSVGSDAHYRIRLAQSPAQVEGNGYAHLEKNWGAQFPLGWIWGQGINRDNSAQFVVSRAEVDFVAFVLDAWVFAFRKDGRQWDYRFDMKDAVLHSSIEPCAATAHLQVVMATQTLDVEFDAPPDTFGAVSVPSPNGFLENGGVESFSANVKVTVSENGNVVAQESFENAAFELGASYQCPQP